MTAAAEKVVAEALSRFRATAASAPEGKPPLVFLGQRRAGRRVDDRWITLADAGEALARGVGAALSEPHRTLEATLLFDAQRFEGPDRAWPLSNDARGLVGLAGDFDGGVRRASPTQTIATNRSHGRLLEIWCDEPAGGASAVAVDAPLITYESDQVLVVPDGGTNWRPLARGRRVRAPSPVSRSEFESFKQGLANWLMAQTSPDGELAYKYWPSRGDWSSANNTIRQFLGTLALGRYAAATGDGRARAIARRNLEFSFRAFVEDRDDHAVVAHGGSAKLGAAALAALALDEGGPAELRARWREKLAAAVERQWRPNGAFRTFHEPSDRDDNQNFYPGEALVFWSVQFKAARGIKLKDRIERSFAYYRDWHRSDPNPAFAPWHTMAYATIFDCLGDRRYRDFIFEMNDWIVALQQLDDAPHPDLRGRFYCPERPDFGPPHASSTAVYMEGLVAAFRVADACGDTARRNRYVRAIAEGLANLRGLQFVDISDFYYVTKRDRVIGGLRTEAYDNTLRVDNAAHALLAALAIDDSQSLRRQLFQE